MTVSELRGALARSASPVLLDWIEANREVITPLLIETSRQIQEKQILRVAQGGRDGRVRVEQIDGGRFGVKSPYSQTFIARARKLRGKWDGEKRLWVFPTQYRPEVLAALRDVYGTAGQPTRVVDLEIVIAPQWEMTGIDVGGPELQIGGRTIVRRRNRDAPVTLGDGVVQLRGEFTASGGSRNNVSVTQDRSRPLATGPVVVLVEHVPVPAALDAMQVDGEHITPKRPRASIARKGAAEDTGEDG